MFIHWFPGHMTKALREMEKESANINCLVYVLDSRIPDSSINHAYDSIFVNKPRLYVLNKADLVPQNELQKWVQFYNSNGNMCITSDSTHKSAQKKFISAIVDLNKPIIEKYKNKGVKKTIRAMVLGVPNCGKSTFINSLIPHKKAATGNKPGVTRGKQWISITEYIELLDTPGTLYPDFSDQKKAVNLAIAGCIKEQVVDSKEIAIEIIEFLKNKYLGNLTERYGEIFDCSPNDYLVNIAKKRGYFLQGGQLDEERAAQAVCNDFSKQAFGKIILEEYEG